MIKVDNKKLYQIDSAWEVASVRTFKGGGHPNVIWQHDDGHRSIKFKAKLKALALIADHIFKYILYSTR